jgi:hypothetical protein
MISQNNDNQKLITFFLYFWLLTFYDIEMAATALTFMVPKRQILTKDDLEKFLESDTYNDFISFIERLNNSVKGLPLSTECFISPVCFNEFFLYGLIE